MIFEPTGMQHLDYGEGRPVNSLVVAVQVRRYAGDRLAILLPNEPDNIELVCVSARLEVSSGQLLRSTSGISCQYSRVRFLIVTLSSSRCM